MRTIYQAMILNAVLIATSSAVASVHKCQEQELYIRDTKTGYSIGLSNKPVKESEPFYLVDGKKVMREDAVTWAKQNMKPVQKVKK